MGTTSNGTPINMPNTTGIETEIKSLLTGALPGENLNDYRIEIVGTSGKGDGFIGDIYFVNLSSNKKNYNFALKRSKDSETLREYMPVQHVFENEMYIYNTILPAFRKFEIERNISNVFDSVPKCFGTFTCPGIEVVVLQNLKTLGYELWDKKLPLPRNHLETVLKLYGRWHAISAAMQDQEPETFEKLVNNMLYVWGEVCKTKGFVGIFVGGVETVLKIWENEIDEDVLNEWKELKDHTDFYITNLRKKSKSLNVITHGDAWNNNFMFKATGDEEKSKEIEVAMLDWQLSGFSSPVIDVSYFLYACVSEDDLKDFDDLLMIYHESFAENLRQLGSDPEKIYTYSDLLNDWKIYGRLGILNAAHLLRTFGAEGDDIPDIVTTAENGEDVCSSFCVTIENIDLIKQRTKCILQHAVERDFIKPIENSCSVPT